MWTIYKNLRGNSGISAYETGYDFIRVKFSSGAVYRYNHDSTGVDDIEQMKIFAASGEGLGTFINKNVRKRFAAKES